MFPSDGATKLRDLSDNGEYYQRVYDVFEQISDRRERMYQWVDEKLPDVVGSIGPASGPGGGALNVLSIGPGNGAIDCKILTQLRETHPSIHAVIVEPDPVMLQQYQTLVSNESVKLQGVDFEWRQQTFDEYRKSAKDEDKFHFVSSLSSIYYLGDIDKSIKNLCKELDNGGILLITLMSGDGGFGRLWRYLHKKFGRRGDLFTSSDVEGACGKQNIKISAIHDIFYRCDISSCFDPPQQLSEEGHILLDFLTHTIDFAQNATAECRDDTLSFMKSEACSERGPAGQVVFKGDNVAIFIRHQ